MGEHPNLQQMRKGYEAFKNGDLATLGELFSDDIVWHAPGRGPISGDYKGKEEVFGLFGKLVQETGGTFKLEVEEMFANDERGVATQRITADRDGKRLDIYSANVFRYDAEGKVVEAWGMGVDTEIGTEFFS